MPTGASGDQPFHTLVEKLLQAAQRGECADVHAKAMEAAERVLFSRAHELSHGNQAKASRWLGVARQTVREKLTQFGLRPSVDDSEE